MKSGFQFGMTVPTNKTRLLKVLPCFKKRARMATWRSGYAAVCKATCFCCLVNDHSDKTANFDPFPINGLAAVSERLLADIGGASGPSTRPRAFWGGQPAFGAYHPVGVGYRAELKGKTVVLNLGYSHQIEFPVPEGIQITVEKQTHMTVSGADRALVGQVSANLRSLRPPDPYKQKGVRITGERLKKKVGKAGAKAAA